MLVIRFLIDAWIYSFQYLAIYNYNYGGKFLLRRIPHALHGSFNPYVISNIEVYIINGNMFMGKVTKCNATTISTTIIYQSQKLRQITQTRGFDNS